MVNNFDVYQGENYDVAIYCRLSNEDGDAKESNSIQNQRRLLLDFVEKMNWKLYDIYIDDGYSGTTFDRPGFKRLLEDIEGGKVNLVITKDMSRLGRDYIQVGYYIERYFPERGVRFIALNDNIDTLMDSYGGDLTPFKAIINDMYSKDISRKIKSVFDLKRREGKFIGAFAPYGYKKDPDNKNALIIDMETAPIVRRIFDMYLSGEGFTSIARKLNKEGILPPAVIKERKHEKYKHGRAKTAKWNHSSVKHILTNPTYTGDLAQGKSKKISYKSPKIKRIPQDKWYIVEDTHPPIISKEKFNLVQELIQQKKPNYGVAKKNRGLFSGFVFCGDCKGYMTYFKTPGGKYYLICSTYKKYGKVECTRHGIKEEELIALVLKEFKKIIGKIPRENMIDLARKVLESKVDSKGITGEISQIEKRLEEIKLNLKFLYEDRTRGLIDEGEFIRLYREFKIEEGNLINIREKLVSERADCHIPVEDKVMLLTNMIYDLDKLTPLLLTKIIDKIEIYEDLIRIFFRFKCS